MIPPSSTTLSTFAPSSSIGNVTLEDIMVQLVRMNARLDTLNDKLCQVNTHVGHIARRYAVIGGFVDSPPPTPEASEDEDNDGDIDAENDGASSPSDDEMST